MQNKNGNRLISKAIKAIDGAYFYGKEEAISNLEKVVKNNKVYVDSLIAKANGMSDKKDRMKLWSSFTRKHADFVQKYYDIVDSYKSAKEKPPQKLRSIFEEEKQVSNSLYDVTH